MHTHRLETAVPNHPRLGALNQNVIDCVFSLKTRETCAPGRLQTVVESPIRCPEAVSHRKPAEHLAFERGRRLPNLPIRTIDHPPLTEHVVGVLGRVNSRFGSLPYIFVRDISVSVNLFYLLSEANALDATLDRYLSCQVLYPRVFKQTL
jgi:hypothetical protein